MAMNEPATLKVQDALRELACLLDAAPHGERSAMIDAFAEMYQWGRGRVYNRLKEVGWSSGRKTRSDCGTTSQDMAVLTDVCATLRIGQRKNGKATMHTPTAVSLLSQNGREITVSNSRVNALLKANQMNMASQRLDRAAQSMRSLHPNHVHQVDPSLCLIYYMPDGKQRIIQEDEFYKNKLENVAKLKLKVWRYVLTDHFSNTTLVRYYQAKGETQANLFDFLLYCWNKQEGRVMHGVPQMLYWDKGSANTAGAIKNALRALQVEAIEHKAKNPRAKGSVENGNNRVECLFESRLMYEPVENVDQLNAAAEGWYNAYNADAIPNYDARLHRKYMAEPTARYALWQMIRREQLRILPQVDLCRLLLSADNIERKVDQELTISFKHPGPKQRLHYDVGHIPGVFFGAMVKVSPLVYGENQVLVTVTDYKNEETTHIVSPVAADAGGFRADGAVYGEEYKSRPDTVIETAGKAADQAAYAGLSIEEIEKAKNKNAVPFGGLDAHSHLKDVAAPSFMDRPGERLNVPSPIHVEIKPLTHTQASMRLRSMLGRPVTAEDRAHLVEWYPDGIMEEKLQEAADHLDGKFAAPVLRLVG
ncbi:MAG TPA: integrase [Gallionellaceae bacterium]|nr:integrase [Gallionellaceae bacterium]